VPAGIETTPIAQIPPPMPPTPPRHSPIFLSRLEANFAAGQNHEKRSRLRLCLKRLVKRPRRIAPTPLENPIVVTAITPEPGGISIAVQASEHCRCEIRRWPSACLRPAGHVARRLGVTGDFQIATSVAVGTEWRRSRMPALG